MNLKQKKKKNNKNKRIEKLKSNSEKQQNSIIEYPLLENIIEHTEDIDTVTKNEDNNSSEE